MNATMNIFTFGSNLAGHHGRGSALEALKNHGAIYGRGVGFQGRSYAIPTKTIFLKVLPLAVIRDHVNTFIAFAAIHIEGPDAMTFNVVKIGCGLAGYKEEEIAPMFAGAPKNCNLPAGWRSCSPTWKTNV